MRNGAPKGMGIGIDADVLLGFRGVGFRGLGLHHKATRLRVSALTSF